MAKLTCSALAAAAIVIASAALAQDKHNLGQEEMKGAIRSYFDLMNAHETQKLIGMFSKDGMIEDPIGVRLQTPTQFFTRLSTAKLTFEIVEMTATDANMAAVALHIHGVNRGDVKNGVLNAIEIFTFKPDGKISGMKAFWSRSDLNG